MIIQEIIGENLIRTYSDKGVYIHGGSPEGDYAEAVDLASLGRTYTETDILIEPNEDDLIDAAYAQAGRILMGVNE